MEEIWKDIEGFEGLYQVSSEGRVRSLDRIINYHFGTGIKKGVILRQGTLKSGYNTVILVDSEGNKKGYYVHRLVAQAFIPNPEGLPEINHKSEVKTENSVDNLEWCDRHYNMNYGTLKKRRSATWLAKNDGVRRVYYKRKTDNRVTIYEGNVVVGKFKNFSQAAKFLNVSIPTVSNRIQNNNKTPINGRYFIVKSN